MTESMETFSTEGEILTKPDGSFFGIRFYRITSRRWGTVAFPSKCTDYPADEQWYPGGTPGVRYVAALLFGPQHAPDSARPS